MIEEKITGSKKNMKWKKKRLLEDPAINVVRISGIYPDKDRIGDYFMIARYERIAKHKKRSCFQRRQHQKKEGAA